MNQFVCVCVCSYVNLFSVDASHRCWFVASTLSYISQPVYLQTETMATCHFWNASLTPSVTIKAPRRLRCIWGDSKRVWERNKRWHRRQSDFSLSFWWSVVYEKTRPVDEEANVRLCLQRLRWSADILVVWDTKWCVSLSLLQPVSSSVFIVTWKEFAQRDLSHSDIPVSLNINYSLTQWCMMTSTIPLHHV